MRWGGISNILLGKSKDFLKFAEDASSQKKFWLRYGFGWRKFHQSR